MTYSTLEERIIASWQGFQHALSECIRPLTPEQLRFRPAPDQRSLGGLMSHIVSVRAGWFCYDLGEASEPIAALAEWQEEAERTGTELADAMEQTWRHMEAAMTRWTPEQWGERLINPYDQSVSERAWVVYHVMEHDLHHGGQVFLLCGLQGIPYPAI